MERSFGIIPLRRADDHWETLLVKHGKGHWAFPKGHPEPGESPEESACRELKEETELEIVRYLSNEPLREFYHFKKEGVLVEKSVTYWIAEVKGEVRIQVEEITDYRWINFEQAEHLATFPESKNLVRTVKRRL